MDVLIFKHCPIKPPALHSLPDRVPTLHKLCTSSIPTLCTSSIPKLCTSSIPKLCTSSISALPRYSSFALPRYPSSALPRYPSSALPRYPSSALPRYPSSVLPRYLVRWCGKMSEEGKGCPLQQLADIEEEAAPSEKQCSWTRFCWRRRLCNNCYLSLMNHLKISSVSEKMLCQ